MSVQYEKKLIDRLIKYVYEKSSIQIDEKQAEIYLDSLADFYIVVSKKRKKTERYFLRKYFGLFFTNFLTTNTMHSSD